MPELPEVETVVRCVRPLIQNRRIVKVVHASELMFASDVEAARARLPGQRFAALERRGKFMFLRLDRGATLLVHLGMTGRLGVYGAGDPLEPHTHLRLRLSGRPSQELRFADARRFGELALLEPADFDARCGKHRLGPDALDIDAVQLRAVFSASRSRSKAILLDQRALAGVGNIYADEALFAARIHPARRGFQVAAAETTRLAKAIRDVLHASIAKNGTSIRNYVTAEGVPGEFRARLRVYGRAGEPCRRCRTPIVLDRAIVNGRATCFCPVCQPAADGS